MRVLSEQWTVRLGSYPGGAGGQRPKKRIVLTTVESDAGLRINGDDAGATIGVHAVREQGSTTAEIRAWALKEGHDFRLSLPSTEGETPVARLVLDRRVRWSPAK
jgi:hypothetical protein